MQCCVNLHYYSKSVLITVTCSHLDLLINGWSKFQRMLCVQVFLRRVFGISTLTVVRSNMFSLLAMSIIKMEVFLVERRAHVCDELMLFKGGDLKACLNCWLLSLEMRVVLSEINVCMKDAAALFPQELNYHHDNDVIII